jgi:hypothetical protein
MLTVTILQLARASKYFPRLRHRTTSRDPAKGSPIGTVGGLYPCVQCGDHHPGVFHLPARGSEFRCRRQPTPH